VYRAAAALPQGDRESAVLGLRDRLRIMADAAGATPDWGTLAVAGPVTVDGADEGHLFEWAASVAVPGSVAWGDLPDPDVTVPAGPGVDQTMPLENVAPGRGRAARGRGAVHLRA